MSYLECLERFQSLLVGVVGFAGVIITLLFNAGLARRQRRDEHKHQRATLRAALAEELRINDQSLRGNLASIEEHAPGGQAGAFVPTEPMEDAYRQFVSSIGLLTEAEVHAVMIAYLYLRTFSARLFLIGAPMDAAARHVAVPPEGLARLKAELEGAIPIVEAAIRALEDGSVAGRG